MKKKTIITSLALLAAAAMVGVGTSVGLTAIDAPDQVAAVKQDEDGTYLISNKDDFFAIFNRTAEHGAEGKKIRLTADIDLEGTNVVNAAGQVGMAGDFNGIFDGNGHKIYNIGLVKDASIFNIIGSKGVIKNATFEFCNYTGNGMGVIRPLSFKNNGLIENVTVVVDAASLPIDNVGPLSYASGLGTYRDSNAYYVLSSGNGSLLGKVYHHVDGRTEHETETVENCKYGLTTIDGNVPTNPWINDPTEGATLLTDDIGYVYVKKSYTIVADEEVTIPAYIVGSADSWHVSWTSSGEGIIDILSSSATEVNIKAIDAGEVTLYGTYTKEGEEDIKVGINISVEKPAGLNGISINAKDTLQKILEIGQKLDITATLDGNEYDEIQWTSSNPDIISVTQDATDPLAATLQSLKEAENPVTITVKAISGQDEFEDAITIKSVAPITFNINYLIEDTIANDMVMTGNLVHMFKKDASGVTFSYTPMPWDPVAGEHSKITIDGKDYLIMRTTVGISEANIADGTQIFTQYVFTGHAFDKLDITSAVKSEDGTWNDVTIMANLTVETKTTETGEEQKVITSKSSKVYTSQENDYVNEAIDFVFDTVAPKWRDENGSMCHLLNNPEESEALTNITNAYTDDLSSEAKNVLDTISGGDGTSIGQSVQYLINNSKVNSDGSRVGIINADKSLGTTAIVAVAITTGAAALGLVYLALRKKSKKAE